MSIPSGTLVSLPDGRNGMVIPSPQWSPKRVLVKVQHGRKRWFKIEDCLPLFYVEGLASEVSDTHADLL